ncbi:MAG: hypothetical protein Q9N26_02735 [Aquificota bacterium]|nr:hypothetical protein [Aquificota bacterium]
MEGEERAGLVDYAVLVFVIAGALYFLLTGYPFNLDTRFPVLKLETFRFLAMASLVGGFFYTLYVVAVSFLSSVRRLENLLRTKSGRGRI